MADDNRITIYAGPPLQQVLAGNEGRSARLNTVAERYLDVVRRDCPGLTEAEWCAICDALNGYWMEGCENIGVRTAWAEIADADRLNGLGEKWGVDAQALAARMRDMTAGAQVALAEVVERFWQRPELPAAEALAQAGASVIGMEAPA
ncbi:MAG TPA: hypothetical protein DCZ11_08895 [Gammaproteobacteria bacterium]|nr:hypothetical protein [Gammaproteobacteria bacterium]MCH78546.1 hypothetical protein [Gammaproteobacteria bacterium]